MDIWDLNNFNQCTTSSSITATLATTATTKKWEDEDVDEEVADSWDQVDEIATTPIISKVINNNLNKIKENIKKTKHHSGGCAHTVTTNNEIILSNEEIHKLQIEADLHLAKEVFGVDQQNQNQQLLQQQQQQQQLNTKDDYKKFKESFINNLQDTNKTNTEFLLFSEEIIQYLCQFFPTNDLKKLHNWIGNLHIEKMKLDRGQKKKPNTKTKQRVKIHLENDNLCGDFTSLDCDDFI